MKIVFGAVISTRPFSPGMAWNWIHHAVGFQRLGHEVYYVEDLRPDWCVDAAGRACGYPESVNRAVFEQTMSRFGLLERACQLYDHGEQTCGLSRRALLEAIDDADVLINMSGHLTTDAVLSRAKRRVYVDQDPVYTQLWQAEYGVDLKFADYDLFFTVGLNIGTPHTDIPDCGVEWHHLLPPVVLDFWPCPVDPSSRRLTTIASWSAYRELRYRGRWYRSKYEEFRRFAELPRKTEQELEVALKAYRNDDEGIRLLAANGWHLAQAGAIAELSSYQRYIARSRGEIGIAQNAYVQGRSGWFSDRSAHYLASGKPVLAQSTGFERCLPTGEGLVTFSTMEEAVAGIERINRDYEAHCRAARAFAEERLDYRRVLPTMLETIQRAPAATAR